MAKKKTAKKKSSKKKATKRKAGKKKSAKKSALKSKTLTFMCSRLCQVNDRNAKLGSGIVVLETKRTSVHIHFLHKRSPFNPREIDIDIPADETAVKFVADDARGDYEYELSCGSCKSPIRNNPKMIVP